MSVEEDEFERLIDELSTNGYELCLSFLLTTGKAEAIIYLPY